MATLFGANCSIASPYVRFIIRLSMMLVLGSDCINSWPLFTFFTFYLQYEVCFYCYNKIRIESLIVLL